MYNRLRWWLGFCFAVAAGDAWSGGGGLAFASPLLPVLLRLLRDREFTADSKIRLAHCLCQLRKRGLCYQRFSNRHAGAAEHAVVLQQERRTDVPQLLAMR